MLSGFVPAQTRALAAALALLFAGAPSARAASDADAGLEIKYMGFFDRNGADNHTPAFAFFKRLPGFLKFTWDQEFDAVSGASRSLGLRRVGRLGDHDKVLDGISGASRREIRHSEKASLAYEREGRAAGAAFYYSSENDYTSYSPSVSAARDFNQRNTTLSGAYALFLDEFHPTGPFAGLGGNRRIQSFSLGLTQVLTPLSLVSLTINPIRSDGYLGHPYNPVVTATGALVEERLPNRKISLAVAGKLVQGWRAGERLGSVHLEARHYRDDWRLVSNTLDVQAYQYLSDATWVRLRARGYRQGQAAFVRGAYIGDEAYRTSDIRFSSFSSLMVGVKVASSFPDAWAESGWLPDRWDLGYDHGFRNTRGESGRPVPFYHYQLFSPDQIYQQGTVMAGLGFDL